MLYAEENRILRRFDEELLCIEPWGANSLRVRATVQGELMADEDFALLPEHAETRAQITVNGTRATIVNGKLRCDVFPSGKLRFSRADTGETLLEEYDRNRFREEDEGFNSALEICPRTFRPIAGTDNFSLEVRFEANSGEKLYGMGQYQQDCLDLKGCIVELAHRNSQASVPFVLSSRGYGLLWNNPAVGRVTFGKNVTEWTARSTRQMDYWITAGRHPGRDRGSLHDGRGQAAHDAGLRHRFLAVQAALPDAGRTAGDSPASTSAAACRSP